MKKDPNRRWLGFFIGWNVDLQQTNRQEFKKIKPVHKCHAQTYGNFSKSLQEIIHQSGK